MSNTFIAINSFPKSGNTWVRTFLTHLCFDGSLDSIPDKYRDDLFEAPTFTLPDDRAVRFYKSHDQNLVRKVEDRDLEHAAVIHIRRHPLDVFLSHLNFLHLPFEKHSQTRPAGNPFITSFSNFDEIQEKGMIWAFLGVFFVYGTLNPRFTAAGSWWKNTNYWMDRPDRGMPIFRYRYEDLVSNRAAELIRTGRLPGQERGGSRCGI
ncbi:MAG: hypothetical protein K0U74_02195 [Alphaproteobacteria bacterium]|nr:hypothetical protein [Alphaproteobacteria bacterium]